MPCDIVHSVAYGMLIAAAFFITQIDVKSGLVPASIVQEENRRLPDVKAVRGSKGLHVRNSLIAVHSSSKRWGCMARTGVQ